MTKFKEAFLDQENHIRDTLFDYNNPNNQDSDEEEEDPDKLEIPLRKIEISDQGKGFEPNSAMAVLHYPRDPLAYWTFDRHETLFEESSAARYQPSPGWNAMQKGSSDIFPNDGKLLCHWDFDEDSMDVDADPDKIKRTTKTGSDITLSTIDLSDATRSCICCPISLSSKPKLSITSEFQIHINISFVTLLKLGHIITCHTRIITTCDFLSYC